MLTLLLAAALQLPKYWIVHIDTPRDDSVATFERLDREYTSIVRDPLVTFSTARGDYFNLRPKSSLAAIEQPSTVAREKTAAISERMHATLRTHHSEIWRTIDALTRLNGPTAPKSMLLRTDFVKPGKDDAYETAMKRVCDDCEKRGIQVLAFWSAYGDGAYHYLFMADAPPRVGRLRGLVASTRDVRASARPDLAMIDASEWLKVE